MILRARARSLRDMAPSAEQRRLNAWFNNSDRSSPLDQVQHALHRIDHGTYGICESCGKPIGKYRLQAFPRATLCLVCKQAEERH